MDQRCGSEIQWCFHSEADDVNKSYILGLMLRNKAEREEYQTFLIKRHDFYSLDALDPLFVKHRCTLLHCQ